MASVARATVAVTAAAAMAGAWHAWSNGRRLRHLTAPAATVPEPVSVLVPARDEAAAIGECVARLRAQTGVPQLEVLVLDDNSTDGTAAVAARAAGDDRRVRVVRSREEPPPGWLGKPFACSRLADLASGSVLVFLDADVQLEPGAVAAAVMALRAEADDLLSAWPRQVARSPLARLVQPLQQWSWLTTLPLGLARRSSRESLVAANGQFLVMTADGYRAAGGHRVVSAAVLDDIMFARAAKRAGLRVGIADASPVASCEMYASDRDLVAGYAKSLWSAFGGPRRGLLGAAALVAVFALPPAYALLGRQPATRLVGGLGYAAAVAGRVGSARATGGCAWPDALAHPLSVVAFAALMATSAARRRSVRWKGRPVSVAG